MLTGDWLLELLAASKAPAAAVLVARDPLTAGAGGGGAELVGALGGGGGSGDRGPAGLARALPPGGADVLAGLGLFLTRAGGGEGVIPTPDSTVVFGVEEAAAIGVGMPAVLLPLTVGPGGAGGEGAKLVGALGGGGGSEAEVF